MLNPGVCRRASQDVLAGRCIGVVLAGHVLCEQSSSSWISPARPEPEGPNPGCHNGSIGLERSVRMFDFFRYFYSRRDFRNLRQEPCSHAMHLKLFDVPETCRT